MEEIKRQQPSATDGAVEQLATGSVVRLLWLYSLPAVIGMVVVSLHNVIDRIFIGQFVGAEAIAGLAVTFPVMNISSAFGALVGVGASARVSILLGQNNSRGANTVLGNALVLTAIISLACMAVLGFALDDILQSFGATDATLPPAHDYMALIVPGLLLINLTISFNNIQRSSGYPRRAMGAMIISAGVNVALDALFVAGFGWGIKGAAVATLIAMAVSMVFVFWHFFRRESTVRFTGPIYRLRSEVVGPIFTIGATPFVINIGGCVVNVIVNNSLVSHGGDMAVGAAGIFTTFTQFVIMVVLGICQGMQPIVGYNYGAGLVHRLSRAYWITMTASTALCLASTAFCVLFPEAIARAFTTDATLIAVTSGCLSMALWAFPTVGFQIVSTIFFQSIGKGGRAMVLGIVRQMLFIIPLLLLLPRWLALDGVWLSYPINDLLATTVTAIFISRELISLRRHPMIR